ncbi:MAG: hypothetical protein ACLUE8_18155 [Lachnospiraceae bacterium]
MKLKTAAATAGTATRTVRRDRRKVLVRWRLVRSAGGYRYGCMAQERLCAMTNLWTVTFSGCLDEI